MGQDDDLLSQCLRIADFSNRPESIERVDQSPEVRASLNASELAAWTMLVNELMNLDEVLNK